jgi:hypothetical protein
MEQAPSVSPPKIKDREALIFLAFLLERFKKYCSHSGRGFLVFWRGFGEGAGLNNPVTEPKRSQNPKRPPPDFFPAEWLQYFFEPL